MASSSDAIGRPRREVFLEQPLTATADLHQAVEQELQPSDAGARRTADKEQLTPRQAEGFLLSSRPIQSLCLSGTPRYGFRRSLKTAALPSADIRLFGEPRLDQRLIRNVALVGGNLDAFQKRNRPRIPPRFRDETEERQFWEAHDSSDYVDWSTAQRVRLPNLRPSTRSISLRLPVSLLERIKIAANKRDVPYQSLIKTWLAEKADLG